MSGTSSSILIRNVLFTATEEEVIRLLEQVGPVVKFRFMRDKKTGKHKGYGICEFRDSSLAESAVRNLNNKNFQGRPLHVCLTNREGKSSAGSRQSAPSTLVTETTPHNSVEIIMKIVKSMTRSELIQVLSETKKLATQNPLAAKRLLQESPPLAMALVQIQTLFGLIQPQEVLDLRSARNSTPESNLAQLSPSKRELFKQLIEMRQEEITNLPPDQQKLVCTIRDRYSSMFKKIREEGQ